MVYYIRKIRINIFNEVYSLHKFLGFMAADRIVYYEFLSYLSGIRNFKFSFCVLYTACVASVTATRAAETPRKYNILNSIQFISNEQLVCPTLTLSISYNYF